MLFATHSIPSTDAGEVRPGRARLRRRRRVRGPAPAVAEVVIDVGEARAAARRPTSPWQLVYQSRSGPPTQPWLEPDINDAHRASCRPRREGRRDRAARLRERPHGGALGPRQRGDRDRRRARPARGARADARHRTPPTSPGSSTSCSSGANGTPAAERPARDRARTLVRRLPSGMLRERAPRLQARRSPGSRREPAPIRIGTRGSALALAQTGAIAAHRSAPRGAEIELVTDHHRGRHVDARRSPASAAPACSRARCATRCSPASATSSCTRSRTCRPRRTPASRSPPCPSARMPATRSARATGSRSPTLPDGRARRHRLAAPRRAAASPRAPTSRSSTSAATSTPASARSTDGRPRRRRPRRRRTGRGSADSDVVDRTTSTSTAGRPRPARARSRSRCATATSDLVARHSTTPTTRAAVDAERQRARAARGRLLGARRRARRHRRRTAAPVGARVQPRRHGRAHGIPRHCVAADAEPRRSMSPTVARAARRRSSLGRWRRTTNSECP